jgi:hypothetical protein
MYCHVGKPQLSNMVRDHAMKWPTVGVAGVANMLAAADAMQVGFEKLSQEIWASS